MLNFKDVFPSLAYGITGLTIISNQGKIVRGERIFNYVDGSPIAINDALFNNDYRYEENLDSFSEAMLALQSESGWDRLLYGIDTHGYLTTINVGEIQANHLRGFSNFTLKSIAEKRVWRYQNIGTVTNDDPARNVEHLLRLANTAKSASSPAYLVQEVSGLELFYSSGALRYRKDGSPVYINNHLGMHGWSVSGEQVEESDDLTLMEAVSRIDWETEELVYQAGTNNEFLVDKHSYENNTLAHYAPFFDTPISAFALHKVWSIRKI